MNRSDRREPPLLFLDIDGVLIPFGGREHPHYPPKLPPDAVNPLLARADPAVGASLVGLGCELVWATTWGEEANASLAPRLGLPPLPVLAWPEDPRQEELDVRAGLHWKTRPVVAHAAGRPFVWVDDEIGDADRRWVTAHHPGPALLLDVEPAYGLREDGLTAIRDLVLAWSTG